MLQFCQQLQTDPKEMLKIVQNQLNNPILQTLITQSDFLSKLDLQLHSPDHCQFFIQHVFRKVREPSPQEIEVMKQYVKRTNNSEMKNLAMILINSHYQCVAQQNPLSFLKKVRQQILNPEQQELKQLLTGKIPTKLEQGSKLLHFLCFSHQDKHWNNPSFEANLTTLSSKVMSLQFLEEEEKAEYLTILSLLLLSSIQKEQDNINLLFYILQVSETQDCYAKKLVKQIQRIEEQKVPIPNCFISKGLFYLFQQIFRKQVYFNIQRQQQLQIVMDIGRKMYNLLKNDLTITQLGWVAIFSVDLIALTQNFQRELHICSSLLRQLWVNEQDLIVECFSFITTRFIQKTSISDNDSNIESVLTILTPKELKYLVLKLNSILSEDKKKQIIKECLKQKNTILGTISYNFVQGTPQMYDEYILQVRQQYQDLCKDIEDSRYNSYEKEIKHFVSSYNFFVHSQLSNFQLTYRPKLLSLLLYYKNLIKEDYLSEQFWLNQQKMVLFSQIKQTFEDFQILFQFLHTEKICNLSSAMIITTILNLQDYHEIQLSLVTKEVLRKTASLCLNVIENDSFASNLTVALQYFVSLQQVKIEMLQFGKLVSLFDKNYIGQIVSKEEYSRIHYLVQWLTISIMTKKGDIQDIQNFIHILPFIRNLKQEKPMLIQNNYVRKIASFYQKLSLFREKKQFYMAQIQTKTRLRQTLCQNWSLEHFSQNLKQISQSFKFWSPTYKEEIVSLNYIDYSPQDNHYFRNHFNIFLLLEYVKVKSIQSSIYSFEPLFDSIFKINIQLLNQIKNGDTLTHRQSFYSSLIKSQICYIFFNREFLSNKLMGASKLSQIIDLCLEIVMKQNYPLIRQSLQVILCRSYVALNMKVPANTMRQRLINLMRANINSGIPIILTLGYELIQSASDPTKFPMTPQIESIHQLLVKFISCHSAYLRAICQYYLHRYLQIQPPKDPFLQNINLFWIEDKDSQKLFKNVEIVVEGFKQAVESNQDFIGFQRVEEYASNRVKMEFYRSVGTFYAQNVLNEVSINQKTSEEYYKAYCEAVEQRYQEVSSRYLEILDKVEQHPEELTTKTNMKLKNQNKGKIEKPKKKEGKKNKGKNKSKIELQQRKSVSDHSDPFTSVRSKINFYYKIDKDSLWLRRKVSPKVVVIATLLEKVHNFGHILRTLQGHDALLVVPSEQPLHHPECSELIPLESDVPIVEIRKKDLHKFIILMKSLGYPMVALEQCSRSVEIQSARFPENFMLLLGNQRLGAPGWLLNEADLLVEIPQVGKIRSLNVHVSMVLCLWQYLIHK